MQRVNFDLDVMRSFVTGMELGSFARAADRLGRSTSAVSAQLKKLEEQAGTPIFRKAGRGLALTDSGELLLGYARRLLELNDEAAIALKGTELTGQVRLGLQQDFGETVLPQVLARFARAHPKVRIEARIARNAELMAGIRGGELDLALAWDDGAPAPRGEKVAQLPLCWVASASEPLPWHAGEDAPLPLAVLDAPCLLRSAAIAALDRSGIAWRLAFVSHSLAGQWAATAAGLALSMRTPAGLPPSVRRVPAEEIGLPALGSLGLMLHQAEATPDPATSRLAELIRQAVGEAAPAWQAGTHTPLPIPLA
ncbi:LysR substrate-binding domain-containing protein [Radicibacter daui]|uniref:LysR substrate-binding domain-containing protein n=1 Tax=Radicibacter daui TaxID=3064829 RepID=UPI0040469315